MQTLSNDSLAGFSFQQNETKQQQKRKDKKRKKEKNQEVKKKKNSGLYLCSSKNL
jgi:hypothetical protein